MLEWSFIINWHIICFFIIGFISHNIYLLQQLCLYWDKKTTDKAFLVKKSLQVQQNDAKNSGILQEK